MDTSREDQLAVLPMPPCCSRSTGSGLRWSMKWHALRAQVSASRYTPFRPLGQRTAGYCPYDAISRGSTFPEYERNARHLAENIAYYRTERIVGRAFDYGETTALLRVLSA